MFHVQLVLKPDSTRYESGPNVAQSAFITMAKLPRQIFNLQTRGDGKMKIFPDLCPILLILLRYIVTAAELLLL